MDFVVQHALDNVWAEELQDKDYYIRPARITPHGGSLKYAQVGDTVTVGLPNVNVLGSKIFYHVYHVGQIPPHLLGIDIVDNSWISLDRIASELECYVNVFLDNGYVVPRSKCHLMRLWPGKNVIMAIENDHSLDFGSKKEFYGNNTYRDVPNTLNNQAINIRFYTNARHFASDMVSNAVNAKNQMYFETDTLTNNVLARIKNQEENGVVPQGWFVSGGFIHNYQSIVSNYFIYQGKEISVYRDETIIGIEYHKLQDLQQFVSKKNRNVKKYVVNLNTDPGELVYHNDVEYYLGTYVDGAFKGLCIPILRIDPITTLTNKTHALRTDIITDLIGSNDWLAEAGDKVYLMLVVRKGGMLRGLIHQSTRIEELFKLPDEVVNSAMTGINSLVDNWKAVNLEVDDYASIVEGTMSSINSEMVFNAYGYNGITKYHHPNPLIVGNYYQDALGNWFSVQLGNVATVRNKLLSNTANLLELLYYSDEGLLLRRVRRPYMNNGLLIDRNESSSPVKYVEHYINSIEDNNMNLGEIFSDVVENNDLGIFGFAAYISTSPSTSKTPKWIDVTNLDTYYYLEDVKQIDGSVVKRLVWNKDALRGLGAIGMVRINNRVCWSEWNVSALKRGGRNFPVITIPNNSKGHVQVEPGSIEVWMHGRLLIEGIDYIVKWPQIYIGRRVPDLNARVQLRMSGLANAHDSKHDEPRETGFVKDGIISVNSYYDIRNDRNIQVNIGGALKHPSEVSFDEDRKLPTEFDGRPYQVRDYITPIELFTSRRTMFEKAKSEEIDIQVMDFMNHYLSTPAINPPVINNTRWLIVSVFMDDIITRLISGWLASELLSNWDLGDVVEWVEPYKDLLEVDIAYFNDTNRDYIRLIPHGHNGTINVSLNQYAFIDAVCKQYFGDKIQINHLLTIA